MNDEKTLGPFPLPTIRRYPTYLRCIGEMIGSGETHVSSAVVAQRLGLDPVLTRRDLAMAGVPGKPRRGYPARELEAALNHALGWDNVTDAALVGVGALGHALLGYTGFREHRLSIVVAFDADPGLVGTSVHGVKVLPMSKLTNLVKRLAVRIGILAVPSAAAQSCAGRLVAAGVRGIWNFTAVPLEVPDGVVVQNVDLAESLAVLSHRTTARPE